MKKENKILIAFIEIIIILIGIYCFDSIYYYPLFILILLFNLIFFKDKIDTKYNILLLLIFVYIFVFYYI